MVLHGGGTTFFRPVAKPKCIEGSSLDPLRNRKVLKEHRWPFVSPELHRNRTVGPNLAGNLKAESLATEASATGSKLK